MPDYLSSLPPLADEAKPGSKDYEIIEWCEARLKVGQRFVESATGYDRIGPALDAVFANERDSSGGASYVPTPKPLSSTKVNLVAKIAEDVTALLTDTRLFFNFTTHNPKYEEQARLSNKEAEDWYRTRGIDMRFADLIRIYTVAGTAFAHLYYSRRVNDMMVEAIDPRHVFPIDPIEYHTVQSAKGVILRQAKTPWWVKQEYNKDVRADVGDPGIFGWFQRMLGGSGKNKHNSPLTRGSTENDVAIPATPTVFVNRMYLNDDRVNEGSKPVYMGRWKDGKPVDSVSYKVKPGMPLYPFKRLIVWCTNTLLYDGPSPYWHGQYPIMKLTLNPWPNSWLGKAPLWDVMPLNRSLNNIMRVIDDHAAQLAQPGVVADRNVSKAEMDKFNSRAPGYKIRTNLASGKGIQIQNPPPLEQSLWEHVNKIEDWMQKLSGTADMSQMAKLAQIPSDDTIDTIMKAMTPGVRLRSRCFEAFMCEFAQQYLYSIAQHDTLSKRLARFGPNAVTREDYDYVPGSFIPDDVPDGDPGDVASTSEALSVDEPRPLFARARQMLQSFSYQYKVGSLLNSAGMQDRLEDLMLSKMGYLSVFTLMENLGKMNFAPANMPIPNSELERLQLQQKLGIGMIANAQGRKATDEAPPTLQAGAGGQPTLATS